MSRILLVGCGATKLTTPAVATSLYTGALTVKRIEWAVKSGWPWFIVSAKHGLVAPNTVLAPYDFKISELCATDKAAWALSVVHSLLNELSDMDSKALRATNCELHMGADYAALLRDVILAAGMSYHWPVKGLGIGEQLAYYRGHNSYARR